MTIENTNFADLPAATRMQEITLEIGAIIDDIHSSSIKIGKLLTEAQCEFKEQGEKGQVFLDWAFENFSIKKAQVYKLMSVAEHFGTDDRFNGVSMRVLYALATQGDDSMIERAAELASTGSLTTSTLNVLLNPLPAQPAPPVDKSKEPGQQSLDNVPTNPAPKPAGDDLPFDMGDGNSAPNGGSQAAPLPVDNEAAKALKEENASLRETLATLSAQLKELQDAQTKFNKPAAPVLPQFKHKLPHVVLGLSEEDSKSGTKIKAAFRDLIKCGYGNGHESFKQLTDARDALLNAE